MVNMYLHTQDEIPSCSDCKVFPEQTDRPNWNYNLPAYADGNKSSNNADLLIKTQVGKYVDCWYEPICNSNLVKII